LAYGIPVGELLEEGEAELYDMRRKLQPLELHEIPKTSKTENEKIRLKHGDKERTSLALLRKVSRLASSITGNA
jgi:hypothetical protein